MAEVPTSVYVCRWCGAPYSVPTVLAENPGVTKRCALGHDHTTGKTPNQRIEELRDEIDRLNVKLAHAATYASQQKGQITRLKKRLEAAAKGESCLTKRSNAHALGRRR